MALIIDPSKSFWTLNPQYKALGPFGELYRSDQTPNKFKSSAFAWAGIFYGSRYSELFNLPDNERMNYIKKEFIKDKFNNVEERILEMETFLKTIEDTPASKQLRSWNRMMEQKNIYMETLTYGKDTYEQIEKLLLSNEKLYDSYNRILQQLDKEEIAETKIRGQSEESLEEKDLLNVD